MKVKREVKKTRNKKQKLLLLTIKKEDLRTQILRLIPLKHQLPR